MSPITSADDIRSTCLQVAGVAAMSGGVLGEVGTYLPGRRVKGVRILPGAIEVHLTLYDDAPVRSTVERVARAVELLGVGPVIVWVHDLQSRPPSPSALDPAAGPAPHSRP